MLCAACNISSDEMWFACAFVNTYCPCCRFVLTTSLLLLLTETAMVYGALTFTMTQQALMCVLMLEAQQGICVKQLA